MQLSGSSTVTMDVYRQVLLTTLAVEKEFSKNKHLLKLSQAPGQQFQLKNGAAKPVLLLMWDACNMLHLLEHPLGNFLLFLKKISKLPPSSSQTKQACETQKLWESDPEPYRTWTSPFPKAISKTHASQAQPSSHLIFWRFLLRLCRAAVYRFQEHAAADIRLQ